VTAAAPAAFAAPELRVARNGGVATLTIANGERMNAMTAAMWLRMPELIAELDHDETVRVICVRGDGERAFSAGADISEFETLRSGPAADAYNASNQATFAALSACATPLVAMIHGHCLGGGLAIAACCDLRLADERSQYAIPAAKLGIGYNPRWLKPLLAILSPARVKELLFTGRRFSAADAERMGLVNRIVPAAELQAAVDALTAEIAANAPLTVSAAKQAINALAEYGGATDMDPLDALAARCFASADYQEGQRAFLDKRRPVFKGQ